MPSSAQLFAFLQKHHIDPSEFEQALSSHFGSAMHAAPDVIVYPGNPSHFALRITYRDDDIAAIDVGPALKAEDITALLQRLQSDVLDSPGRKIGGVVLFAHVPTQGFFRYKDIFQILPVPADAPRPPFVMG